MGTSNETIGFWVYNNVNVINKQPYGNTIIKYPYPYIRPSPPYGTKHSQRPRFLCAGRRACLLTNAMEYALVVKTSTLKPKPKTSLSPRHSVPLNPKPKTLKSKSAKSELEFPQKAVGLEAKSHSWLRFFGLGVQFRVEVEDFGLKTFVGSSRIRKSLRGRSLRNKSCEFPRVLYIYIYDYPRALFCLLKPLCCSSPLHSVKPELRSPSAPRTRPCRTTRHLYTA